MQYIPNLLRFNAKGEIVSSDISSYFNFECRGIRGNKTCHIDKDSYKIPSDPTTLTDESSGVVEYAQVK
jgi:hypothetical protein